jgi:hypothetical protein
MSTEKFWVVWQPESGAPTYRHDTYERALKEAERLAETVPGREFFVMEAMSVSRKVSVITTPLTRLEDDLPF